MSTAPATLPFARATWLVAEREITTQVRKKAFLVSLAITLVLALAGIVVAGIMSDRSSTTEVAVTGQASTAVGEAEGLEAVQADDAAAAEQLVRDGDVSAAVVPDTSGPLDVKVIALDEAPTDVVESLSVSPTVDLLEPGSTDGPVRFIVSLAFGLVFMMAAIGSGTMIAQNTVQEKQTRIVEILLSAVSARALIAGKVLGNTIVAVGQTAALAAVSAVGLLLTGQGELLDMLSAPLIWFVVFFLFGFVLVAAVFAGGAALVSRQEDIGSAITPAMMLVMLPYFAIAFFSDNALVMTIMSYVPFSAPVGMPVRMFLGEAAAWEPLVSLALLLVAAAVVVAIAAKIYTRSLLQTGPRVKIRDALRSA
ncbi:MAG TPA: ABC transporter permease [Jiangellaceae bacterium]|nr:ABC transporter permease [Jiangellaceae bacterium]